MSGTSSISVNTTSMSTEGFTSFSVDQSHPFYVHPSDSPGIQLTVLSFDGNDLVSWRKSMLISL